MLGFPTQCRWSLLLINFAATELVPIRIDSTHGDRAALTVRRHDDATAIDDFTAFRDVKPQDAVIDYRVRTEIRSWFSCNRVVGAIDLATQVYCVALPSLLTLSTVIFTLSP